MRITQGMLSGNILTQLSKGYGKMADYQQQLASGKKITRPSQDPVVAALGIGYREDASAVEQYQRNVTDGYKWLDSSDSALSQTDDVLNRIRELTVQASNGTNSADDRNSIKQEIDQMKQQLVTIGNSQIGERYIFNGNNSSVAPISIDSSGKITVNNGMNNAPVTIDVNHGVKIQINVDPQSVFNQGLFDDMDDLENALSDGNTTGDQISDFLSKIDDHLSHVSAAQADLGAKMNRMDLIQNRLAVQKEDTEKIMSSNEDADFESTVVNLTTQQSVYNAALSVGAKMMQPTLADFIK
ncbi:flagellar hook-associated protein FlgL [Terrilactibacillus sp. BCM23-1]|uniref:Flagellar hook-associated protein FlgL n=1 Tax=Terrilactibacillus tamarindi TaxID=2599694 RepID=A0A6N8CPM4_9BACI|nr:flagellar hook-associated protein FlgL [Terrilactibacillus tamarindi]MTT31560.1 flagellar hook-associated protein FlgL [Terrilactibacillus tamarindi]